MSRVVSIRSRCSLDRTVPAVAKKNNMSAQRLSQPVFHPNALRPDKLVDGSTENNVETSAVAARHPQDRNGGFNNSRQSATILLDAMYVRIPRAQYAANRMQAKLCSSTAFGSW